MSNKAHRRFRWNILFGFLVSIIALIWVFHSVEKAEVFQKVRNAHLGNLIIAIVATLLSYLARSYRWPFFFRTNPPSFLNSFRCLIIGFFANNISPARMGELVRAHVGGRVTHQSRTYVLATIAGERLADGLTISALFAFLFSFQATAAEQTHGKEIFFVVYLFVAAAMFTAFVLSQRERVFGLLEKLGRTMPGHLSEYTLLRLRRFIEGLEPLMVPSRIFILSMLSLCVWGIELFIYAQVAAAFDCSLSLGGLSLFLAAVNFSSLIPSGPAGFGVIELVAKSALVHIGVDPESALAMVVTQHLIQFGVVGIPGVLFSFDHFRQRGFGISSFSKSSGLHKQE